MKFSQSEAIEISIKNERSPTVRRWAREGSLEETSWFQISFIVFFWIVSRSWCVVGEASPYVQTEPWGTPALRGWNDESLFTIVIHNNQHPSARVEVSNPGAQLQRNVVRRVFAKETSMSYSIKSFWIIKRHNFRLAMKTQEPIPTIGDIGYQYKLIYLQVSKIPVDNGFHCFANNWKQWQWLVVWQYGVRFFLGDRLYPNNLSAFPVFRKETFLASKKSCRFFRGMDFSVILCVLGFPYIGFCHISRITTTFDEEVLTSLWGA